MPKLSNYNECTGCSACVNACKKQAIKMQVDNTGFLFPMLQEDKCVNCGICEKVCPVLNMATSIDVKPEFCIIQNKDENVRKESTSGGAFTAIAKYIIKNNGVVFGAVMDKDYCVKHVSVYDIQSLKKFRNSKYVQSEIGNSYIDAEKFLKQGKLVGFSGTPCQIQGLKKYLGREYENLITVDFMCRAVPSPKIFKKYLQYMIAKYPEGNRLVFRDKHRGYSYSTLSIYANNKILYCGGSESDQWLRLFLGGYCNRLSCHDCKFQSGNRISDFTLWDCWNTHTYAPEWDDNKGTTNVIAWNEKAKSILDEQKDDLRIKSLDFSFAKPILCKSRLSYPSNYDRKVFFDDSEELSAEDFFNKYVPMSLFIKIKGFIRFFIYKFHLHDSIRKLVHMFRKLSKSRN